MDELEKELAEINVQHQQGNAGERLTIFFNGGSRKNYSL